jgi:hypothetical protein
MANWNGFEAKQEYDFENFEWVNKLEKHMELYANWKDSDAFDFLFKDNPLVKDITEIATAKEWLPVPKNHDDLIETARIFTQKGFDIYWKDVTIPEVAEFGKVIKVIIPQMIPLSQAYSCRWLEPFKDLQEKGTLNPYPHPFS